MAVSVTTERGIKADTKRDFENGMAVFVVDGHLYVSRDGGNTIGSTLAVFSPGSWVDVEVTTTKRG